MMRFFLSLIVGLLIGVGFGLYLGWVQFPVEYVNSPFTRLDPKYHDEYTVMVAAGYLYDRDVQAAIERLRRLGVGNIPEYVQGVTERYISNSRSITDIRYLVALSEALGRLTPPMEPYRQLSVPGVGS